MSMEHPLTGLIKKDGTALNIEEYRASGGYEGLRKALSSMSPADVIEAVKDSGLRGRGGAGFPTGQKWEFMPSSEKARHPKYFACNADEMEPGTFKDRILIEGNPHQLLEGVLIACYALEVNEAYIFLRWEYREATRRLKRAIEEARAAGIIGQGIMGLAYNVTIHLHSSAGRYMCGEETTMISAIEGTRPFPRAKPPHTQLSGLWGRSTVTNNAETVCNIPHIVRNGAAWYRALGITESGTKMYAVTGHVRRPGAWELPMGTMLRELLEEHAGGMAEGYAFRALIPGGASTEFVLDEHLDVHMDFEAVRSVGSRLGTGTAVVLDDKTCPVGFVHSLMDFFARESCGWCTPCREGLPWIAKTLRAIEDGHGMPEDMVMLRQYTKHLGVGRTYCLLAPGAMEPLTSALKYFEEDFIQHIEAKSCPWNK